MQIPTQYRKRVFGETKSIVGRHKCGWITDGCFMVKTSFMKCYPKLKLAETQYQEKQFNYVVGKISDDRLVFPEKITDDSTDIMCVKRPVKRLHVGGFSIMVDKVYYDYFKKQGCSFKLDRSLNKYLPIAIVSFDEVVGYVMGIEE